MKEEIFTVVRVEEKQGRIQRISEKTKTCYDKIKKEREQEKKERKWMYATSDHSNKIICSSGSDEAK